MRKVCTYQLRVIGWWERNAILVIFKQENKNCPSHFLQMRTSCKESVPAVKIASARCGNLLVLSLKQKVTLRNLDKDSLHTVCQVSLPWFPVRSCIISMCKWHLPHVSSHSSDSHACRGRRRKVNLQKTKSADPLSLRFISRVFLFPF